MSNPLFESIAKDFYAEAKTMGKDLSKIIFAVSKKLGGDTKLAMTVHYAVVKDRKRKVKLNKDVRSALNLAVQTAIWEQDLPDFDNYPDVDPATVDKVFHAAATWAYAYMVPSLLVKYTKVLNNHVSKAKTYFNLEGMSNREVKKYLSRVFQESVIDDYTSVPRGDTIYLALVLFD